MTHKISGLIPSYLDGTAVRFDWSKSIHRVLDLPLWLREPFSDKSMALGALRLIEFPKPRGVLVSVANKGLYMTDVAALERALL